MATITSIGSLFGNILPSELVASVNDALSSIGLDIEASHLTWDANGLVMSHSIHILEQLRLDLPMIPGSYIEFEQPQPTDNSYAGIGVEIRTTPVVTITLKNLDATLNLSGGIILRHQFIDNKWRQVFETIGNEDPPKAGLKITLVLPKISLDFNGNFDILSPNLTLVSGGHYKNDENRLLPIPQGSDRFGYMISDTGVLIEFAPTTPPFDLALSPVDGSADNSTDDSSNDEETNGDATPNPPQTNTVPNQPIVLPSDFRGVKIRQLSIQYIKEGTNFPPIVATNVAIGSGGFWGEISLGTPPTSNSNIRLSQQGLTNLFTPPTNTENPNTPIRSTQPNDDGRASVNEEDANGVVVTSLTHTIYPINISGMKAAFQYFGIGFRQSIPQWGSLRGFVFMPFADKWVSLRASIGGPNGDFMLEIGGVGNEGLVSLETDVFKVTADSLAYQLENGINYAVIAGSIRLKKPEGLNIPDFNVQKLKIGSNGDVKIEGGWLRAPEQVNIDLGGFKIGIKEIGFGTEDGRTDGTDVEKEAAKRQWVGFSGEVQLIESIPIKGSVDGLKISWNKHQEQLGLGLHVELKGIKVAFKIPGAMEFDGEVNYDRATNLFKGQIKINFISLRFEVEAHLMVGKYRDSEGREFGVFYIHLGAKFPVPIVLGATGMGLSGVEGLVGINVAPNKTSTESWRQWYKEKLPEYNIVDVSKWAPMNDNYAFGAGVKIGTVYDDGTTLNITALLAVLIPGPVIMLQGTVNLLKPRSDDKKEEGLFNILAVLDCRAGTFQLNIDVRYSLQDIITISGGLEAFFNFNNSEDWHIWVGQKTPESKRIRADILKIFSASTYFMIDPHALMVGASVGLNIDETYGPARVILKAHISFDVAIFFKPFQLEGVLELGADLGITVFGIGLRLMIEAMLGAKTPKPFEIYGRARVKLQLFWPIPEVGFDVEFRWTQPAQIYPTWPLLKELEVRVKTKDAAGNDVETAAMLPLAYMQHHKSTSFEARLLRGVDDTYPSEADIPYVPIDSRPRLTFSKSLHLIGDNVLTDKPDEVGNTKFWYHLDNLTLQERAGTGWVDVLNGINIPAPTATTPPYFQLTVATIPHAGDTNFINDNTAKEPIIELWKYGVWDTLSTHTGETVPHTDPACGRESALSEKRIITWTNYEKGNLPQEFWKDGVLFVVAPYYTILSPFLLDISPSNPVIPYVDVPQLAIPNKENMLRTRTTTLYFPKKIYGIQVLLAQDDFGSVDIKAFSNGNLVGTSTKSAANYECTLSVNHALGFNSVTIEDNSSNDKAFWIHTILYVTTDRPINIPFQAPNSTNSANPAQSNFEPQRTQSILKPATTYRLTVMTKVTSDKSKPVKKLENESDLLTNNPTIDYFYFKTDNGPGFPLKPNTIDQRLSYAPEAFANTPFTATNTSEMAIDPNAKAKPNPVNLLSTYVLGTYPTHGAMGHYFKEPVVIAFNEVYLFNMWKDRRLELRFKDRNGTAKDKDGHDLPPVVIDLEPQNIGLFEGIMPLMNRGLTLWTASLRLGGCQNNKRVAPVMTPVIKFDIDKLGLAANTLYFAELWSNTKAGLPPTLSIFDFQFTTSRFESFTEHIAKLGQDAQQITKLNRVSPVPIKTDDLTQSGIFTDKTSYHAAVATYKNMMTDATQTYEHSQLVDAYEHIIKLRDSWEKKAADTFDALYNGLSDTAFQITALVNGTPQIIDMRHRGLPEKPEIIQIPIENSTNSLLLWESPEPMDWISVTGKILADADFCALPNKDKTRVFFLIGNQLNFSTGRFTFTLDYDPFTDYTDKVSFSAVPPDSRKAHFTINIEGSYFAFKHVVTSETIHALSPNVTIFNHPQLNGNPNLVLFVSAVWGNASGGVNNPNTFGVRYADNRWTIFNQNKDVPMVLSATFHVLAAFVNDPHVFVHTATAETLSMNRTYINHPKSNNRPNALLMATQQYGEYNNREIGISYESAKLQWFVYNKTDSGEAPWDEVKNGIPLGAQFNILVVDGGNVPGISAFAHQANINNINQYLSFMDNVAVNGKADAKLFFTESWLITLNGQTIPVGGIANKTISYLWYDDLKDAYHNKDGYWSIHNADNKPMEQNRMFNIFAFEREGGTIQI